MVRNRQARKTEAQYSVTDHIKEFEDDIIKRLYISSSV